MPKDLLLTLVILGASVILFLSNRLRPDLVALLVVVALGGTGLLTPQEAFSGFSRSAVITIMSIFIIAEGLERTGVSEQAGALLLRVAGKSEPRLVMSVMVAAAALSFFMNNIAAAAVLLPAVAGAARKAGVYPSRLLMPLAFGTILGGMATLLTTANIIVSSLLRDHGIPGYGLLDFAPVGVPIVIVGVVYMALWGRKLLPAHSLSDRLPTPQPTGGDLVDTYRLGERLFRARVPAGSSLIGRSLAASALREGYGLNLVAVEHGGSVALSPSPDTQIEMGDILILEGHLDDFRRRDVEPYLEILPPRDWRERDLKSPTVVVAEAMLAPRSPLIHQTLRSAHFRERYGMSVLAVWRAGRQVFSNLADLRLRFGDTLLLQGPRERLPLLRDAPELILLAYEEEEAAPVPGRGRLALAILALTLVLAAIYPPLVGEIMLGGALAMILCRMLTMDQAYLAIDWRSVFLVAGMLPMGLAISKSGAATLFAAYLTTAIGPNSPLVLIAGLFAITALLTQAMSGAAVAAVIAPIAIQAAQKVGADPRTIAMAVALGASTAFVTPLGHPVNVLVMGPGGYRFRDYLRVGTPLALLVFAVVMVCLPLFWHLTLR